MATYGYLRVSTLDQDNGKFRHDVLEYANSRKLGRVNWVEEKVSGTQDWKKRELGRLLGRAKEGDRIIVPELSRLARSVPQIWEIIEAARGKGVALHVIKQGLVFNGKLDVTTKVLLSTFAMIAELERDFISIRTKEALAERKRKGVKLGRPKGPGKSRLDPHREDIVYRLALGVPQAAIARTYEVGEVTLHTYIAKRGLKAEAEALRKTQEAEREGAAS